MDTHFWTMLQALPSWRSMLSDYFCTVTMHKLCSMLTGLQPVLQIRVSLPRCFVQLLCTDSTRGTLCFLTRSFRQIYPWITTYLTIRGPQGTGRTNTGIHFHATCWYPNIRAFLPCIRLFHKLIKSSVFLHRTNISIHRCGNTGVGGCGMCM